ncbi:btb poz domain-containing protein [Fusarium pseudocircinatum]|uniref:Btb poz domain-containing protein n=1 Tax=Fusarium pseudocircinatum TaxID=56676 RepID=A0A8H5NWT4_9HYPO|nr:btb poz domain-containing protein [Fusarium pseudocircinatum]
MANATDSQIVEIVPDGDIILVVGPDKTKLRVKSMLLMAASKPFSVMLGPNWKEGHDMRHRNGPFELLLPDDDATALEIICSVIHFQNDRIQQTLPASDVLAVAIAADKYDCLNSLQFASEVWLRELEVKPRDLMLLTAAAYLFQNPQAFKEHTASLVLNHHGSYLSLFGEDTGDILPWEILHLLEEQRGFARLQLADILIRGIRFGFCYSGCGWTGNGYTYAYMKKLENEHLFPAQFSHMPISKALEKAEIMSDPRLWGQRKACTKARDHTVPGLQPNVNVGRGQLNKLIGLCLECVRGGSRSSICKEPSHTSHRLHGRFV